MSCRRYLILLGLASTLAMAQSSSPQVAAEASRKEVEKCSIEGNVVRVSDGAPLKKAIVTAMPQQPKPAVRPTSAISDAEGKFVLKDLEPGRYSLMAVRTGYTRQIYGQRTPASPAVTLTLVPGQSIKDIVFRLLAGAAISGRVVDEDSEPISGVRVQVLRWGYMNGKRELVFGGFAETDDRGEYRLFQLAPGRYYISASYSGAGYIGGGVISVGAGDLSNDAYPPTYYPGVNDPAQASALEVKAGDELSGVNVRLLPTHAVRVTGRVLKAGDGASRDAWVALFPKRSTGFAGFNRNSTPGVNGTFEFRGVISGSYVVQAEQEEDGKRYQARTALEVGSTDVEGVVLVLQPPLEVAGRIRVDGSLDLSAAVVRVVVAPRETIPMVGGGGAATVNSELGFTLMGLSEGDYTLRLYGLPPDAYVSSATMGQRDVLRDGVLLHGPSDPLQIVVSASGGRLEGSVLDENDQPFTGARVVLVPEESEWKRTDLFKIASSDQYGQFLLRGIPPGKYKLFAFAMIDEGAYYDPEFLGSILEKGKSLEISPGMRVEAQLKLIRGNMTGQ